MRGKAWKTTGGHFYWKQHHSLWKRSTSKILLKEEKCIFLWSLWETSFFSHILSDGRHMSLATRTFMWLWASLMEHSFNHFWNHLYHWVLPRYELFVFSSCYIHWWFILNFSTHLYHKHWDFPKAYYYRVNLTAGVAWTSSVKVFSPIRCFYSNCFCNYYQASSSMLNATNCLCSLFVYPKENIYIFLKAF